LRIYISADGEGISGVVHTSEMHESGRHYAEFRKLMTQDVNAAIEGAFAAGATEVVVNDSHWSMMNLIYSELDPRADVIRGGNKNLSMVEQIEQFDGAFLVGYHAKVGHSDGVANETMLGFEMYEMRMNGVPIGEMELNAAIAGFYGVPIIMVSGDDQLAREAKAFFGNVEAAIVKYAIDRWSARCLSLARSHQVIKDSAFQAVKRLEQFNPYIIKGPVELEIEWTSTSACKKSALVPGSYRKNPRTIAYRGDTILEAWKGIYACLNLGELASDPIYG
jgi:D-amino peptidase